MKLPALLAAIALLSAAPAFAADPALMKPVHDFADGFNAGDLSRAQAAFVPNPVISDELAPHLWTGPSAYKGWHDALMKDLKDHGDVNQALVIDQPTREVASGATAYLIVPAAITFQAKGRAMREEGQITVVLNRLAAGWKIATWTWTSAPVPAPKR